MKFNQFDMLPYISGSPTSQSLWIDDITVSTAPPSGLPGVP
jgi:hypothetical protein